MRLPMYSGVHSTVAFASRIGWRRSRDGDEPVVGDAEDERRVAAPALGIAVLVQAGLDEDALLLEVADDLLGGLDRRQAVQPAEVVVEAAGLVDGHEHRQVVHARELEVLGAAARRDVDDAGALVERDVVPRDHAMLDGAAGPSSSNGPSVAPADELARRCSVSANVSSRIARDGDPLAVRAPAVLGVGLTAAATFAGSVHGVVVQMTSDSPGRSSSGKRT